MEENDVVFMSIKEEHILRIVNKTKNHEFRNKIPKDCFKFIIVYVPAPVKQIKYILEVSTPVKKLQKINEEGIGNKKFNDGNGTEFAYPINHCYELNKFLELKQLEKDYNFTAPQSFTYGSKYSKLFTKIKEIGCKKLY